jgi:hypothetical protein
MTFSLPTQPKTPKRTPYALSDAVRSAYGTATLNSGRICAKFGIFPISPQSILPLDEQLIR